MDVSALRISLRQIGNRHTRRWSLKTEHRLAEWMLSLIRKTLVQIESTHTVDQLFLDTVADFIQMCADRTHRRKEEEILLRTPDKRRLSEEERRMRKELLEERAFGRKTTRALLDAGVRYQNGETSALAEIMGILKILVEFYPRHIEKEKKIFFPASDPDFTDAEDQTMLTWFLELKRREQHAGTWSTHDRTSPDRAHALGHNRCPGANRINTQG